MKLAGLERYRIVTPSRSAKGYLLAGLIVVTLMIVYVAHLAMTGMTGGAGNQGYPAIEGVKETIVNDGIPVPGLRGGKEMIDLQE